MNTTKTLQDLARAFRQIDMWLSEGIDEETTYERICGQYGDDTGHAIVRLYTQGLDS